MLAAQLSKTLGHWDDAERQLRSALLRDPLTTYGIYNLGATLYLAGRFADADAAFRRLLELAPDFSWTRWSLAKTLLAEGKPDAALAMAQQEPTEEYRLCILPIVLQAVGRQTEADEALKSLTAKYAGSEASFDRHHLCIPERTRACASLARSRIQQKDTSLIEIVGEPLLKNIASNPRYKLFMRKMNLPD